MMTHIKQAKPTRDYYNKTKTIKTFSVEKYMCMCCIYVCIFEGNIQLSDTISIIPMNTCISYIKLNLL